MAQHPEKLMWKEKVPFGLSASQFGMALGFHGKVSDFVDYQRNIVGTEQEFRGNAATEHGIRTEAKARALYELLTGYQVYDGGFFVSEDGLLGCSPDGRSFYYEEAPPGTPANASQGAAEPVHAASVNADYSTLSQRSFSETGASRGAPDHSHPPSPHTPGPHECTELHSGARVSTNTKVALAVKIPFKSKRTDSRREGNSTASHEDSASQPQTLEKPALELGAHTGLPRRRVRLLEIKSPFMTLYDCSRPTYRPFGIPPQYMCQMQGQMAIAGADECDFFVYLDAPRCQVEAWRVYRCDAFWSWACPKMLEVVRWTRDGLPPHVNRSFQFEEFDFSTVRVEPLVFPYCISTRGPLEDLARFSFFIRYPSPYYKSGSEGNHGIGGDHLSPAAVERCQQTAEMVRSDVVRFLFDENGEELEEDKGWVKSQERWVGGGRRWPSRSTSASRWRPDALPERQARTGHFRIVPEAVPLAVPNAHALLDRYVDGHLLAADEVAANGSPTGDSDGRPPVPRVKSPVVNDGVDFAITTPTDWEPGTVEVTARPPSADVSQSDRAPRRCIRFYHREFFGCLALVACKDTPDTRASPYLGSDSRAFATPPPRSPRRPSPPLTQRSAEDSRSSPRPVPVKASRFESISQQIRLSLTPMPHRSHPDAVEAAPSDTLSSPARAGSALAAHALGELGTEGTVAVLQMEDLATLLQDAQDCVKVFVTESLSHPVRYFWREEEGPQPGQYALVVGPVDVLTAVVRAATDACGARKHDSWHRSVSALVGVVARSLSSSPRHLAVHSSLPGQSTPALEMVFCFCNAGVKGAREDHSLSAVPPLEGLDIAPTPTLLLHAESMNQVLACVVRETAQW